MRKLQHIGLEWFMLAEHFLESMPSQPVHQFCKHRGDVYSISLNLSTNNKVNKTNCTLMRSYVLPATVSSSLNLLYQLHYEMVFA